MLLTHNGFLEGQCSCFSGLRLRLRMGKEWKSLEMSFPSRQDEVLLGVRSISLVWRPV